MKSTNLYIEPGASIRVRDGHVFKVHIATGKMLEDFGEIRHSNFSSARGLPSTVATTGNSHSPEGAYTYSWIAWSKWQSSANNPINSFSTTFVVPPAPSVQSDWTSSHGPPDPLWRAIYSHQQQQPQWRGGYIFPVTLDRSLPDNHFCV